MRMRFLAFGLLGLVLPWSIGCCVFHPGGHHHCCYQELPPAPPPAR